MVSLKQFGVNEKGFTLMEITVVAGLIAVLGTIIASLLLTVFRSYNRSQVATQMENTANYLLDVFENSVRSAQEVSLPSSNELQIRKADGSVWSFRLVSRSCSSDHSNNFVSYSASGGGGTFLDEALTPTDPFRGVDVADLSFTENDGIIEMSLSLTKPCALPDRVDFNQTTTYRAKAQPRSRYGQ